MEESQFKKEVSSIVTTLEKVFEPFWNDETSMVKVVYENNTVFVHFALKSEEGGWVNIPRKKIFFLSEVLKTCLFKDSCNLTRGTFTLMLSEPLLNTEKSIKAVKEQVILLRNYYS